jgi:alpha-L-arabinofuranosidase
MEPATTRVWAEMLSDRKFVNPIVAADATPMNPFMRLFMGEPFRSVGPAGTVEMDPGHAFVGEHSPRIKLDASEPHGIQQSSLHVGKGKSYTGRIYLSGSEGAKVVVRLVWGAGANDSQTIQMPALTQTYKKIPLKFTSQADTDNARLEILGTGSGVFHVGTASLMPADNVQGFRAGMIKQFKNIGFLMAKWPGGNFVSAYDWYDGLGDIDKRPPRVAPMWSVMVEPNDVGIHEFITFCRLVGAEPDVAVNSGFGEARVAAELVEYCNGSINTRMGKMRAENGHPEPFNVRLWTIGNEMYGPWQFGHMSMDQYAIKHRYFVEAMRKVEPKIKVTSAGASICEQSWCAAEQKKWEVTEGQPPMLDKLPYEFGARNDADGMLLSKSADYIDFVSEHTYCYPDWAFDAEQQSFVDVRNEPLQSKARRLPNRVGAAFAAWDKYVARIPELKTKDIKFIFDEWGCRFRAAEGSGMGGFHWPTGMLSPMNSALFLHEVLRHSDKVGATCPTGSFMSIVTDVTGDAVAPNAEGLMIKIMSNHFANARPVAVDGNSPQQQVRGTAFVDKGTKPTGSPTYPLDVLAALSADGKKFLLSIINPTEEPQEITPQISGVKVRGAGKLSQIAAPSVEADNEPGKEPIIKIVETAQASMPEKVKVPPISVSVYEFEIA